CTSRRYIVRHARILLLCLAAINFTHAEGAKMGWSRPVLVPGRANNTLAYRDLINLVLILEVNKAIPYTSFGEDVFGVGRVFFNLLAQVVNIQAQVVGFITIFVSPYFGQQGIVGHNPARVLDE